MRGASHYAFLGRRKNAHLHPPSPSACTPCHALEQVTMDDFDKALKEVKPAFGTSTETLESFLPHGIIPCGDTFERLQKTLSMLIEQVRACVSTAAVLIRVIQSS